MLRLDDPDWRSPKVKYYIAMATTSVFNPEKWGSKSGCHGNVLYKLHPIPI